MGGVLIGFGIIAVVVLAGYLVGRSGIAGPSAGFVLNRIAFFVASPALLFSTLARADPRVVFSVQLLIALISAAGTFALYLALSRIFFRRPAGATVIGVLSAGFVNANNIGLPVAAYVLGSVSYVAPVLLLQLLVIAPIALTILDVTTRGAVSVRAILLQPFRNPMIVASLLGVTVSATGIRLPPPVLQPFELVGGAAVPLVLLAFGISLHGARPMQARHERVEVITAVALKAIVMPALAYVVARYGFGLTSHALFAAVTLAALPTAQNVFNFAARYRVSESSARDVVLLTMVFSVPVLVGIAALLT